MKCPYCRGRRIFVKRSSKGRVYICLNCGYKFSPKKNITPKLSRWNPYSY